MNQKIIKRTAEFHPEKLQPMLLYKENQFYIILYHNLLIYNVKRSTDIDGMGPFKYC